MVVRRRQRGDDLSEAVHVLQDWKRKQLLVLEVTRVSSFTASRSAT